MARRRANPGSRRPKSRTGSSKSRSPGSSGGYTPVIILAIFVACVAGFWKPVMKIIKEKTKKKTRSSSSQEVIEVQTIVDKDGKVRKVTKTYNPEDKFKNIQKDNSQAELLLDEAEKRLKIGEFKDSVMLLEKILRLDCKTDFKSQAKKLHSKADFFAGIAKRSPSISTGKSKSALREEFRKQKMATAKEPVALWKLAKFALMNKLNREAAQTLEQAWKMDSNFKKTVYEARANKILADAMYFKSLDDNSEATAKFKLLSKTYKRSEAAATAREILREEKALMADSGVTAEPVSPAKTTTVKRKVQPVEDTYKPLPAVEDKPIRVNVSKISDPLEKKAETAYITGIKLFSRGARHPDINKGREMIDESLGKLDNAINLFQQLVRKNPSNAKYKERLHKAKVKKLWAGKFNRIG
ncbi:MAG: tetratricopeptide repeat protein [Planctomycetota bacterium]|jgi:tetratricopeptide (TPR) repeat protein